MVIKRRVIRSLAFEMICIDGEEKVMRWEENLVCGRTYPC